jgi:thiol-disulfide isomerase/thioredoxin
MVGCVRQNEADLNDVLSNFSESADQIQKLEYTAQVIDTFERGSVWNHTGYALIEKDAKDELFGFAFYGVRDDIPKEYIYQDGIFFEISITDSTYCTEDGQPGILGMPGGQMISRNLFQLDSVYSSVTLSEDLSDYILTYRFEDDTTYLVENRMKVIRLVKGTYFPWRFTQTYTRLGNRFFSQMTLKDIKVNGEVRNSIDDYLSNIRNFTACQPVQSAPNKILNTILPQLSLPDVHDESKVVHLPARKLTLIDFWEVWCGHCVASLPKVEELWGLYGADLQVLGIVSDDSDEARKILKSKGISFQNLIGSRELEKEFGVNGWPRYFLVDKNGIVLKEYFGFSDQIESDIKNNLESKDVASH